MIEDVEARSFVSMMETIFRTYKNNGYRHHVKDMSVGELLPDYVTVSDHGVRRAILTTDILVLEHWGRCEDALFLRKLRSVLDQECTKGEKE